MVWNREDMKDIVSETALLAYERFDTIRQRQALLSFLFTIASRIIYKYNSKKKFIYDTSFNHHETIADTSADAQTKLEAKELFQALNTLPHKQREALVMFEISGFSLTEIQVIQGDSLSAVKSRLARGRETLKKMFEEKTVPVI
jgi:RNA polymerase sigma-70 factor (ECF subfamily)